MKQKAGPGGRTHTRGTTQDVSRGTRETGELDQMTVYIKGGIHAGS
jgi:hypothetical protein